MKNPIAKAATVLLVSALALTGCTTEYDKRKQAQGASQIKDSLEKKNLEKKRDREENPSAERYLYLMNFGQIVGYYVTKGKISSNGSQVGPESEIISSHVLDSAKDDGTYGAGDPGIFFFTSDDVMVETSLDYIQSDQPLAVDVPRLRG